MTNESLGLGARLVLAFVLPWKLLFNGSLAARVKRAELGGPPAEAPPALTAVEPQPEVAELAPEPEPPAAAEADYTPALQLLAILQREGRFIDFLQEDLAGAGDADIGAAARVVHEGCKRGLDEYLKVEPVRTEDEGAPVTLAPGFDAVRNRVTGAVVGEPPYSGTLAHHGWQVSSIELPTLAEGHDPRVLAPAEVEI